MKEIIDRSANIITITQDETIQNTATIMRDRKVGCVIVVNRHQEFVGLVTERDIAVWVSQAQNDADVTSVKGIMTDNVVSCTPGTPSGRAREIMASHRIRHLPIVDKGTVVGILSIRDLMGQQLLEDRAAAEEVAMLSNCLKSIDLEEAGEIVAKEAPKLFQAQKCMLCMYEDGDTSRDPGLRSQDHCDRSVEAFKTTLENGEIDGENAVLFETVPPECQAKKANGPRLLLPIKIAGLQDHSTETPRSLNGYICMCGLSESSASNQELISYKAKLAKKILTSHLTNATLYHQARLTSITDALTGVGSRKMLEDTLDTEHVRAQRYQTPFTVAIIDLDNFKSINDVLGHAAGDDALKKLAVCMKAQLRNSDILARYGGDEFVVLMPETSTDEAQVMVERLRCAVHEIRLAQETPITISCGVAQSLLDEDRSPSDVMRRADLALYDAKSAGRDCVKVWNQTMSQLLDTNDIEIGKVKQIQRRVAGLSEKAEKMFIQSIWGLVQTLEAKNPYAQKHSEHVMHYAVGIAKAMDVGPKHIDIIRRAAMLHDIGKIGIPDSIMSKPGIFTRRERKIMEQHPLIAVRILEKMNFLEQEIDIVRHHHEKWNGRGYPDALIKDAIPEGSRIIVLADTLDALTAPRAYHEPKSLSEAIKILIDCSSYEFDPDVVKGLLCWIEELGNELGKTPDEMTVDDLLASQGDDDSDFAFSLVEEAMAATEE
jgi:diguanylate cyclase (GGDEF)-like protein/putative nucleotidyltransferase with HDIG domain